VKAVHSHLKLKRDTALLVMPQGNVEIVRAVLAAWNEKDIDAVRDAHDPNTIFNPVEGWPESGPFVGREAVMAFFEQLGEAWDTDAFEPTIFIDARDRVVVRMAWRGAFQGTESSMEFSAVYTLRKERILYTEIFWDHAEALEAVGLSEKVMPQDNVEFVRSVYAAFCRLAEGDDIASYMTDYFEPDCEYRPVEEEEAIRGHDAMVGLDRTLV
jgi:ketosteroid isomerase-like protein